MSVPRTSAFYLSSPRSELLGAARSGERIKVRGAVPPGYLQLSTPIHKSAYVRCAAFGFGLGARREHTRQRSVTEEQQRPKPNAAQPFGRQVFLRQTSLLAPYRPLTGMRVARASSGTKIPCRERNRIYELEYLGSHACLRLVQRVSQCNRKIRFLLVKEGLPVGHVPRMEEPHLFDSDPLRRAV